MSLSLPPFATLLRHSRLHLAVIGLSGFALVACGIVLARTMNLAACPLCILQRMLYLLLCVEAVVSLPFVRNPNSTRVVAVLMAATAGTGAWIAGYQTWLQRFAQDVSCTADQPWWEQFVNWAGTISPMLFEATGFCSDPGWKFIGLSIAEWSLLIFTSMTLLAVAAIFRKH